MDLDAIERVMVEKQGAKLKAKGKGGTAPSKAKGGRVPKKGCSEKFCQRCKAHSGPFQTHKTLDCDDLSLYLGQIPEVRTDLSAKHQ